MMRLEEAVASLESCARPSRPIPQDGSVVIAHLLRRSGVHDRATVEAIGLVVGLLLEREREQARRAAIPPAAGQAAASRAGGTSLPAPECGGGRGA